MSLKCHAVVPAAGVGRRLGGDTPKQYRVIAGKTILEHSIQSLLDSRYVEKVIVAISARDSWWPKLPLANDERVEFCEGGAERVLSVIVALERVAGRLSQDDWVLVHDAVRPCLTPEDVNLLFEELVDDPVGGLLAVPARDTLKKVKGGRVVATLDRSSAWQALTPQMFRLGKLRSGLRNAINNHVAVTDEASAMEASGVMPKVVQGRHDNLKVTWPEDLDIAEGIIAARMQKQKQ